MALKPAGKQVPEEETDFVSCDSTGSPENRWKWWHSNGPFCDRNMEEQIPLSPSNIKHILMIFFPPKARVFLPHLEVRHPLAEIQEIIVKSCASSVCHAIGRSDLPDLPSENLQLWRVYVQFRADSKRERRLIRVSYCSHQRKGLAQRGLQLHKSSDSGSMTSVPEQLKQKTNNQNSAPQRSRLKAVQVTVLKDLTLFSSLITGFK